MLCDLRARAFLCACVAVLFCSVLLCVHVSGGGIMHVVLIYFNRKYAISTMLRLLLARRVGVSVAILKRVARMAIHTPLRQCNEGQGAEQ
jgi:hypothetical protein